jgi:hypothetical protein
VCAKVSLVRTALSKINSYLFEIKKTNHEEEKGKMHGDRRH